MKNIEIATVNEWWKALATDVKSLITGIHNEAEAELFWQNLYESDKRNIYQWQTDTDLCEDDKHSLFMEIVCELADIALVSEYGIPLDDMTDEDGSFYEEYQDRFNDLYDEIEDRLSTIK